MRVTFKIFKLKLAESIQDCKVGIRPFNEGNVEIRKWKVSKTNREAIKIIKLKFVHSMCSQPDRSTGSHPRKATSKMLPRQATAAPFALNGGIVTLRSCRRSLEGRKRNDTILDPRVWWCAPGRNFVYLFSTRGDVSCIKIIHSVCHWLNTRLFCFPAKSERF